MGSKCSKKFQTPAICQKKKTPPDSLLWLFSNNNQLFVLFSEEYFE